MANEQPDFVVPFARARQALNSGAPVASGVSAVPEALRVEHVRVGGDGRELAPPSVSRGELCRDIAGVAALAADPVTDASEEAVRRVAEHEQVHTTLEAAADTHDIDAATSAVPSQQRNERETRERNDGLGGKVTQPTSLLGSESLPFPRRARARARHTAMMAQTSGFAGGPGWLQKVSSATPHEQNPPHAGSQRAGSARKAAALRALAK